MKTNFRSLLALNLWTSLLLLQAVPTVLGQSPATIAYQGFLVDTDGEAVTEPSLPIRFSLFSESTGGTLLWTEFHGFVEVTDGVFAVELGTFEAFDDDVTFGEPLFLETAIGDPPDVEVMSPRIPMTAVPYSLRAGSLDDGALTAGDNVTIERDGQALRISAAGGQSSTPSLLAAPDGSPAQALVVDNDGQIGIGTSVGTTLSTLHIRKDPIALPVTALEGPGLLIEAANASASIFSDGGGEIGSALIFGETAQNRLVDKWSIVRETSSGAGQSRLHFTFGPNRNYAANDTKMTLTTAGRLGLGIENPEGLIHVRSPGDAEFILEADINNREESNNPTLTLRQDGNRAHAFVGLEGIGGSRAAGTLNNALLIGSEDDNPAIQFLTNDQVRMTIGTDGSITTPPRGRTIIISAIEFNPSNDGYEFLQSPSRLSAQSDFPHPQIDQFWFAPVHLPQGAVVTRVTSHWFDLRSPELLTLRLVRDTGFADGIETLATLDSVGSAGNGSRTDDTIQNATIDNGTFMYYLRAVFPRGSDDFSLGLRRVVIEYTMTQIQ